MKEVIYSFSIEETGKELSQILLKPGDRYVFGRGKKLNNIEFCDYIIDRSSVSRVQATLVAKESEVLIILDGDGKKPSSNGVFDSEGDRISVHKNVNPGDSIYICLESDFKVILSFLETINDDTIEIEIPSETDRIKILERSVNEVRSLLKSQLATTKASNREIKGKEQDIISRENTLITDVDGLKTELQSLKTNVEELKKEVTLIHLVNAKQTKALYYLALLICTGMVLFGLTGSFKELSKDEKKDFYLLIQELVIVCVGGVGGTKLLKETIDNKK